VIIHFVSPFFHSITLLQPLHEAPIILLQPQHEAPMTLLQPQHETPMTMLQPVHGAAYTQAPFKVLYSRYFFWSLRARMVGPATFCND